MSSKKKSNFQPKDALNFTAKNLNWSRLCTEKINGKWVHDVINLKTNEIIRNVEDEKIKQYLKK
jgi:hypothetical protein